MIIILTCLLGFYFAYLNRMNGFISVFLFTLFLMPLLIYWGEPSTYQYRGYVPIILTGILFLCNIRYLIHDQKFINNITRLFYFVSAFLIILLIASLINNYSILSAILYFRNFFWGVLLFVILLSTNSQNIKIDKILLLIVIIQLILSFCQYIGDYSFNRMFLVKEYVKDGSIQQYMSDSVYNADGNLIVGSLEKVTRLGNFLALFIVYYYGTQLKKIGYKKYLSLLLLGFMFITILMTGVRISLLTSIAGVLLCYLLLNYTFTKMLSRSLFVGVISLVALPVLITIGSDLIKSNGANYGNGLQRSLTLFGVLGEIGEGRVQHQYTMGRSIYITKFINIESLPLGTGIYMRNQSGYGIGIDSISDAQLLFIITEFGIVILFMCCIPYLFSLRELRNCGPPKIYKMFQILFFMIILQMIVDAGIFDALTSYFYFILCACTINNRYSDYRQRLNNCVKIGLLERKRR